MFAHDEAGARLDAHLLAVARRAGGPPVRPGASGPDHGAGRDDAPPAGSTVSGVARARLAQTKPDPARPQLAQRVGTERLADLGQDALCVQCAVTAGGELIDRRACIGVIDPQDADAIARRSAAASDTAARGQALPGYSRSSQ